MNLEELCHVIQDVSNINITVLSSKEDFDIFCETWKFHEKQAYLKTDTLEWLFQSLDKNKILCYLDCFRIRFSFLWINKIPIAFGPYCTEILTRQDCTLLTKQAHLDNLLETEILAYRSNFPITEESTILHLAHCIAKHMLNEESSREIIHINASTFYPKKTPDSEALYKPYAALVQERYKTELEFMENIRMGNRTAALKNWKTLHNSVEFLKRRIGYTLEGARNAAAVTRTTIRLAGMEAGLPAELGDWLTSQSAKNIREAKNIEAINKEHERLIQEYCTVIHEFRNQSYSSLILSSLYYLEHLFQQDINISTLAAELDVSVNHLIKQFKKETGLTPGQFLQQKRLKYASWLLVSSNLPIQEVSLQSGFPDANYFSKLFLREYNETPSRYRKKYRL